MTLVDLTHDEISALLWHADEAELCRGWPSPPDDRPISTARAKLRYAAASMPHWTDEETREEVRAMIAQDREERDAA